MNTQIEDSIIAGYNKSVGDYLTRRWEEMQHKDCLICRETERIQNTTKRDLYQSAINPHCLCIFWHITTDKAKQQLVRAIDQHFTYKISNSWGDFEIIKKED